jgi:amino acid transporter
LFYAVTDLEAVMGDTTLFPLSSIYRQATGSRAGQMGLSMILFLPCFWAVVGAYVTAGRTLWTLGRDNATPFSKYIGALHPKYQNPYNATLAVCIVNSLIGLTYLGSTTAFNAFATSVLLLMITGYLAVIGAHLLSGRSRVRPGIFWMKGWIGTVVHTVSCLYTLCFTVIFSFPYSMPVAADTMNYSSLIFGGLTILVSVLWVWKMKHGYTGLTDGAVLGQETAQEGATMVEVSQASSTQKLQE